jgi:hypothetical protein
MYKNFKLTDKERKQILESHMSHGYKQPLNELGDREIDLVRGIPDFKTKSGLPVGDYVSRRNASRQFQQDFQRDFPDPKDEYKPYWEKDKSNSDGDSELDLDMRSMSRRADRELGTKKIELSNEKSREERIRLRRRIASLVSHKEEFGGDEELDRVIERLRAQAREMDDNK